MSRKLYIFDCFGVVMSDVSTLFMDKYLNAEQQLYMRKKVFRKVDVGAMDMDKMFDELSTLCGLEIGATKREWTSYEYVLEDTVEVIKQFKAQGHCVVLLSNAAVDYVDYLFKKYDLFKYFDHIFVSANYGYAKPDKELYRLCVDSFDEQFDSIYFIDNNPDNLQDLQQFNITPILFSSAQDLKDKVGLK